MEVLLTFLAERYQQNKTLALTSNIVFSTKTGQAFLRRVYQQGDGSVVKVPARESAILNPCKTPNYGKPEPGLKTNRLS